MIFDLMWDGIPQGRAWKWRISFKKVYSCGFGRSYVSWCGANVQQIKSCLRYGGARFLYSLNTDTALLNISFSLSGSIPKYRSFVSVDKEESDIINVAALLWRELSLLNKISIIRERERERERERIYWVGDDTFDMKVPRVGVRSLGGVRSSPRLTAGKKVWLL